MGEGGKGPWSGEGEEGDSLLAHAGIGLTGLLGVRGDVRL